MKKVPDLVFIIDTNYESLAIKESLKLSIPIIAILDTNSDPEGIDFPIPGNDDARRSIDLYCNLMKQTIIDAKKNANQTNEENLSWYFGGWSVGKYALHGSKEIGCEYNCMER